MNQWLMEGEGCSQEMSAMDSQDKQMGQIKVEQMEQGKQTRINFR
jgi:hypothetical protein